MRTCSRHRSLKDHLTTSARGTVGAIQRLFTIPGHGNAVRARSQEQTVISPLKLGTLRKSFTFRASLIRTITPIQLLMAG